eukprot:2642472-Rhodomonas_salina.5
MSGTDICCAAIRCASATCSQTPLVLQRPVWCYASATRSTVLMWAMLLPGTTLRGSFAYGVSPLSAYAHAPGAR